jgi:hypothetical protein
MVKSLISENTVPLTKSAGETGNLPRIDFF